MDGDVWATLRSDAVEARRRMVVLLADLLLRVEPGCEDRLGTIDTRAGALALASYVVPTAGGASDKLQADIRRLGQLLCEIDELSAQFEARMPR